MAFSTQTPLPVPTEPLPQDIHENVEVDERAWDSDSAYGGSMASDSTSVNAELYQGYMENGRRYQATSDKGYFIPSDSQQFECQESGHLCFKIMDCQETNPLFRSPIGDNAKNIIDIGTGEGSWTVDTADKFPHITVHGVDLYPPPQEWAPANCILEVDDVTKEWTWHKSFDLAHMRILAGAFEPEEWDKLYRRIYDNLEPGGWIEHIDFEAGVHCDDNTMPKDCLLARYGKELEDAAIKGGRPIDSVANMRSRIERAGFINIHEKALKVPLGAWPKHPVMKDAGRLGMITFKTGVEGFAMHLLTTHGSPQPWTQDQVKVFLGGVNKELDKKWHIYQKMKRVWAQKPYDAEPCRWQPYQNQPLRSVQV